MIIYTSEKVLPYVYKLTHKVTGQFYFGSRYTKYLRFPSHIDIIKYQSSSKKIKELGFENFDFEIIAEFFCGDDAWQFEQQLITEHYNDPLILNRSRFKDGSLKFIFREQSEEGKENLRKKFTGRKLSEDHKRKIGLKSAIYQKGSNNSQFGHRFKFVNNGHTQHKVNVDNLNYYVEQGWAIGRLPQLNRNLNYKRRK